MTDLETIMRHRIASQPRIKHAVQVLKRRAEHLARRIDASRDKDLTYDRQEYGAIECIVGVLSCEK
jgi:hypothetical protein